MPGIPNAYELKEYILFVNVGAPYDASTETGMESSTFATAFARIVDLGGAMDAEDMQHPTQIQEFEIWVRYIEGLTGFMEINWGSRSLTITGPPEKVQDGQGRLWHVIRAKEVIERDLS